jgi:hypothetical protein
MLRGGTYIQYAFVSIEILTLVVASGELTTCTVNIHINISIKRITDEEYTYHRNPDIGCGFGRADHMAQLIHNTHQYISMERITDQETRIYGRVRKLSQPYGVRVYCTLVPYGHQPSRCQ